MQHPSQDRRSRGGRTWGRRLLYVPVVLALGAFPALTVGSATAAEPEGPYIVVAPGPGMGGFDDTIEGGGGWPVGDTVTVEIVDPAIGPDIAYTTTTVVPSEGVGPYDFYLDLSNGVFDVRAGQIVTVSDVPDGGTITKSTTVTALTETAVDPGTDTVTGTAAPGSEVFVQVFDAPGCACRTVQADVVSGAWIADFAVPGNPPDTETYNITGGTAAGATQFDADGDRTTTGLFPPVGYTVSPNLGLSEGQHVNVSGFGLSPGSSYVLEQCVQVPFASFCDTSYDVPLTLDPEGSFGATDFVVHANIDVTVPGGTNPIDCRQDRCYVGVIGGPGYQHPAPVFIEFSATPLTKADCKDGGWQQVVDSQGRPFKNQGDCVSFVATHGKN